jgi:hypothetical protein
MAKPYISLQPSEQTITNAASRIYAAYIVSGSVTEGKEDAWIERSIREAVRIAQVTDSSLQADKELD